MEIIKKKNESKLEVALEGRLDTTTSPELEKIVQGELEGVSEFVLDFEKLDYVSSAGLRVILSAQKIMNRQGDMVVRNVCEGIMEVFEITGFCDILTIE